MIDPKYQTEYMDDLLNYNIDVDYSACEKPESKYIIKLKRFRLYKVFQAKNYSLWNFNSNNDITPWIAYKFRCLKEKIFGVEVYDEPNFWQIFFKNIGVYNYYHNNK